ncbi:MAG: YjfB family protein [Sulfuricella sp.]
MDISGASSISTLSGQATGDAVGTQVLKKALEIQAQNAKALVDSLPQPVKSASANLPQHLGQNVNTTA